MAEETITRLESSVVKYAFDVEINAPQEKVWRLLTTDISSWWPPHFNSSPDTKQFVLEPFVGGRLYEDQSNGDGVLWGHVVHLSTPNRIQIQGAMFPEYGGPGTFILSFQLEAKDAGCLLKVSDSQFGYVTDDQVRDTKSGWTEIANLLKKTAEA